jgi:hypothetical protein
MYAKFLFYKVFTFVPKVVSNQSIFYTDSNEYLFIFFRFLFEAKKVLFPKKREATRPCRPSRPRSPGRPRAPQRGPSSCTWAPIKGPDPTQLHIDRSPPRTDRQPPPLCSCPRAAARIAHAADALPLARRADRHQTSC